MHSKIGLEDGLKKSFNSRSRNPAFPKNPSTLQRILQSSQAWRLLCLFYVARVIKIVAELLDLIYMKPYLSGKD